MIVENSTVVARGLAVRRAGRWLLRPATFGVRAGVVGLAGPAKTGKSTLLATLATLRRPHSGSLEILGFDIGDNTSLRSIRARIGFLPEHFSWAANLTVGQFVAYAAYYKCVPGDRVRAVLERMELADTTSMELSLLPPDVRLRVGLAATCVHGPDLVLLDEPLAGLDERATAEITALLPTLAPTVLVTAEDSAALGRCDQLFTVTRGRLVETSRAPDAACAGGRDRV
ncbi:ABC transporter ATP-binding protein [Actinomadura craniellae]|uniref:ABC transporter ATP-binding protein n=1 Tax=Actinomadura craniellae TaxID=2231787 RepID=A0A365H9K8_9ACTN|nr:ATP-binding cassette domain-containing protein [Actinomadura craniellae]RAY15785.1 ABC transporter ATP-binding protein [Actinomadura craniellae]